MNIFDRFNIFCLVSKGSTKEVICFYIHWSICHYIINISINIFNSSIFFFEFTCFLGDYNFF